MESWMINPIVILVATIIVSTIALIGAAVLGIDKGVLRSMGRPDFARGLITYLFSIVTIGTAAVIVLSSLTASPGDAAQDKQFQQGKEVLSLLLGVFGTIIGYYFGAEASSRSGIDSRDVRLSSLDVSPAAVEPEGKMMVRAVVTGGVPPYLYGVAVGEERPDTKEPVGTNSWISKEIIVRELRREKPRIVRVVVEDGSGHRVEQSAS